MTAQKNNPTHTDSSSEIISYLEGQLANLEEELKTYDIPLDKINISDVRQVEELIIKKQVYLLKGMIKGAKAISKQK